MYSKDTIFYARNETNELLARMPYLAHDTIFCARRKKHYEKVRSRYYIKQRDYITMHHGIHVIIRFVFDGTSKTLNILKNGTLMIKGLLPLTYATVCTRSIHNERDYNLLSAAIRLFCPSISMTFQFWQQRAGKKSKYWSTS